MAACTALALVGLVLLGVDLRIAAYGRLGKMRMRDPMLGLVPWTEQRQILDVVTGAGLLMVGAAKRLTSGRAVGIDIGAAKDLSGNGLAAAEPNAAIEAIADRAGVLTCDARRLAFQEGSFDRVLSQLCLHKIEGEAGQDSACQKIARVLRAGRTVLSGDWMPTHGYAATFRSANS